MHPCPDTPTCGANFPPDTKRGPHSLEHSYVDPAEVSHPSGWMPEEYTNEPWIRGLSTPTISNDGRLSNPKLTNR